MELHVFENMRFCFVEKVSKCQAQHISNFSKIIFQSKVSTISQINIFICQLFWVNMVTIPC